MHFQIMFFQKLNYLQSLLMKFKPQLNKNTVKDELFSVEFLKTILINITINNT